MLLLNITNKNLAEINPQNNDSNTSECFQETILISETNTWRNYCAIQQNSW